MKNFVLRVLLLAATCMPVLSAAQDSNNSGMESYTQLSEPVTMQPPARDTPLSPGEFTLSMSVLAFGLVIILLEIFLVRSKKIGAEDTIKFITITLIITATLFLITAGYSNDQIAPAVGLLGTIAGYLLGRAQSGGEKGEGMT